MYSHPKLNLIGLAAPARAGKSTVAAMLREFRYTEESFAGPIRQFVADLAGLTLDEMEQTKERSIPWIGKSPREMMQTLGTEWGRELVSRSLWADRVMQRVRVLHGEGTPVVISDVRFDNEAEMIRAAGGTVLHIVRPDHARTTAHHMSEAGVSRGPSDYFIFNDGTLNDLKHAVTCTHYLLQQQYCPAE